MIKKIYCPTDFSDAAANATEYAAKLAQVLSAQLMFVNVSRITPAAAAVSLGEGIGANAKANAAYAIERLKDLCVEVNKIFNVSTDYEVNITTHSLKDILTGLEMKDAMIVTGTNGADNMYQRLFGSNSYNVVQEADCPVMIVPENAFYGSIKKIAFAWGYDLENAFSFQLFEEFRKLFNPEYVFLHLSKRGQATGHEVYKALRAEIGKVLGDKPGVDFDQVFSDEIPAAITRYMKSSAADILAINYNRKGPVASWFFTPAIKQLVEKSVYPILVLPL